MSAYMDETADSDPQRLRDVVALSTLPAIWFQSDPQRIAESLAAALLRTTTADFIHVRLELGSDRSAVSATDTQRNDNRSSLSADAVGQFLEWSRNHDPEELIEMAHPFTAGQCYVSVRPLGHTAEYGVIAAGCSKSGLFDSHRRLLLSVAATQATIAVQNARLLYSLHESIAEKEASQAKERKAREEIEILQNVSRELASELDMQEVLQRATDAATQLSGANFGALFYNVSDEHGESYQLYCLSGAPREAFKNFSLPRNTAIFDHTFRGLGTIRLEDVTRDPRYGKSAPHYGMPKGHLPVRSYLAVPVTFRSGDVLGGLFLGHREPGVFTERAERLVQGIGAQLAIAVDNARLYGQAQEEIAVRRRHQEHQELLLNELNHRVKNMLATVQSIAMQTLNDTHPASIERDDFLSRLFALANVHDLLSQEDWTGADLRQVLTTALAPYGNPSDGRFVLVGPELQMTPRTTLTLGMAFHELATNASKYGALSQPAGQLHVEWAQIESGSGVGARICWKELRGPPVLPPKHRGFGSILIERGVPHELRGNVTLDYEPEGLACTIEFPLDAHSWSANIG